MRIRGALLICGALLLMSGCSSRGGSSVSGSSAQEPVAVETREFPPLQIPKMYTTALDRATYAAEHFWDSFLSTSSTFSCDSLTINGVPAEVVEEHFATYAGVLTEFVSAQGITALAATQDDGSSASVSPLASATTAAAAAAIARKGITSMFRKVEAKQLSDTLSNVYDRFAAMAYKYFYDPNSPYRCEDLYFPYVQGLAESPLTDPRMVPAYTHDARMCSLNSIGSQVPDFVFRDIKGRNHRLYDAKADFTLLFFSNPGCEACKEIIETIKGDMGLEYMISSGALAVVNVYIDEDIDAWKSYQDYYPTTWMNGYDPTYSIRQDIKYNVRAIPSLYLLDSGKRVIMKDAPENRVFDYLNAVRVAGF